VILLLNVQTVLKALSDETRLRILNLLYEQELCVCDIMETLQISQTKASRHLGYMKNAGLLNDRKQAQWVHYSLIKHKEGEFIESLIQANLRNEELYRSDLEHLSAWLKVKDNTCIK
jgi:ArsR family transcriptional regulator